LDKPTLAQNDAGSTPEAPASAALTRRVRVNFSSTIKDGWHYEATIEVQGTGSPGDIAVELTRLDQIAKVVGESGVIVRQRGAGEVSPS
jgi:hypothetical protein